MKQRVATIRKKIVGGVVLVGLVTGIWYMLADKLINQPQDNLQNDPKASLSNLPPGSVRIASEPRGLWSLDSAPKKAIRASTNESTKTSDFATQVLPDFQAPAMQAEAALLMSEHLTKEILVQENPEQILEGPPEQVIATIANVIPRGDTLNKLVNSLITNPDPRVRSAAAKQLALGGGRAAASALLEGLRDDNKTVVMDALSSLVQIGDASLSTEIERAAQSHADADVRNSLVATAEQLRSRPRMDADQLSNSD